MKMYYRRRLLKKFIYVSPYLQFNNKTQLWESWRFCKILGLKFRYKKIYKKGKMDKWKCINKYYDIDTLNKLQ